MQSLGDKKPEKLSVSNWEDERGRLRMWAANIGAHQTGQSSLDFRLRDSSQIKDQVIKLLENLNAQLKDTGTVLTDGEESDLESIYGSDSGNEEPQSEIQQLQSNVKSLINCLFDLLMLVRKPTRHDFRKEFKDIDLPDYYIGADLRHVEDKFPKANDKIIARLGHANTCRRKYLKYRESHAAKLRKGIDSEGEPDGQPSRSAILSETVATAFNNSGVDEGFGDNASDSGVTQTSYASTLFSGSRINIPAAPEASRGGAPFECPYCYCVVTAPNSRTWSRHVFSDLEPYVCTEPECTMPNRLYATRHEWLHHMKTAHHQKENQACVLCGYHHKDQVRLGRHIAQHLQELSLFVLPRRDDDSEEDVSDAKSGSDHLHLSNDDDDEELSEHGGMSEVDDEEDHEIASEASSNGSHLPKEDADLASSSASLESTEHKLLSTHSSYNPSEDNPDDPQSKSLDRPTYIKVHRKHLSPDTLDAYDLPWEWDEPDTDYMIIKRWINENDQDKLFEHTRRLREQREDKLILEQRAARKAAIEEQERTHGREAAIEETDKNERTEAIVSGREREEPNYPPTYPSPSSEISDPVTTPLQEKHRSHNPNSPNQEPQLLGANPRISMRKKG
ncbi:MAG: hypothetical protein Q9213_008380 [Squamulea squamosa]